MGVGPRRRAHLQNEDGGPAMGVGMRLDAVIRKRRMRARLLTKTVSLDIGERWEAVVTRISFISIVL